MYTVIWVAILEISGQISLTADYQREGCRVAGCLGGWLFDWTWQGKQVEDSANCSNTPSAAAQTVRLEWLLAMKVLSLQRVECLNTPPGTCSAWDLSLADRDTSHACTSAKRGILESQQDEEGLIRPRPSQQEGLWPLGILSRSA